MARIATLVKDQVVLVRRDENKVNNPVVHVAKCVEDADAYIKRFGRKKVGEHIVGPILYRDK